MTRKRIVFFVESFSGGGAERALLTILKALDLTKFEPVVLVVSDVGVQRDHFHNLGVEIIEVCPNLDSFIGKLRYKLLYSILPPYLACRWICKGINAEAFVAFVEGYCTKIFSRLPSAKNKIAWVHTDLKTFPWPIQKRIYDNLNEEKAAYRKYDSVIGVSETASAVMRSLYGIENTVTVYNPIAEDLILEMKGVQSEIDVDHGSFNIISVGRLTAAKGYDRLISIMPRLLSVNPRIKLYIVGEGEDRDLLEKQIERLGLKDKVFLPGFLHNPYALMNKMDLFVCSSIAEGFSLVIAEAMTVGLPIVSMACAGPKELLDFGKYGILCNSYSDLAQAIGEISNNPSLQAALRDKAVTRSRMFNTVNTIHQIEALL